MRGSPVLARYHFRCSLCPARADTQSAIEAGVPALPRLPDGWSVRDGAVLCMRHATGRAKVIPFLSPDSLVRAA